MLRFASHGKVLLNIWRILAFIVPVPVFSFLLNNVSRFHMLRSIQTQKSCPCHFSKTFLSHQALSFSVVQCLQVKIQWNLHPSQRTLAQHITVEKVMQSQSATLW